MPYRSSFTFEPGYGSTHVYNLRTDVSFDESELNSIMFREIVDTYSISREATRELVYLFRTILKNNLEGAEFKNGKYLMKYISLCYLLNLTYKRLNRQNSINNLILGHFRTKIERKGTCHKSFI